jgi:hypothetical protein
MAFLGIVKKSCLPALLLCLVLASCQQGTNTIEPINRDESRIFYTKHARCRMDCRHITDNEIREILHRGVINYGKSEPQAHPDPKYALEGYTQEGQHLRIIFAPVSKGLLVITCIELGVEWSCHCN